MSAITTPKQFYDDGMSPVLGLDPTTGRRYMRANGYVFEGSGRWMEWYAPDGTVLLRIEQNPATQQVRIAKGSIEAVRAVNPEHFNAEAEADVLARLTDEPFDCMAGVVPGAMEACLAAVHEANAPILAGAA